MSTEIGRKYEIPVTNGRGREQSRRRPRYCTDELYGRAQPLMRRDPITSIIMSIQHTATRLGLLRGVTFLPPTTTSYLGLAVSVFFSRFSLLLLI